MIERLQLELVLAVGSVEVDDGLVFEPADQFN